MSAIWALRSQSERRNPESANYVPFATAHTFTNTEFIEAWRWSKDKNKQTWITHDLVYVCVNKGVDGDLTRAKAENFVTKFMDFQFESFDDYTSITNNVCILTVDQTRQEGCTCTCKQNAKEFACIHSLGVAMLRGTIIPPIAARVRLLGRKRRRGRRPQAAPAWMRQPFNLNSPIAHPEQNEAALAGLVLPDMPAFDDIMNE